MEPAELLRTMVQGEVIPEIKIEVKHIAQALHCSNKVLYALAREGKCPFISAAKGDNKIVTYLIWPAKAEEYIGRERLIKAIAECEAEKGA